MKSKTMSIDLSKAKVGDKFVTRAGKTVSIRSINPKSEMGWVCSAGYFHYKNGRILSARTDDEDILAPAKRPVGHPRKADKIPAKSTKELRVRNVHAYHRPVTSDKPLDWMDVAAYLAKKGHDAAALDVLKEKVQ